MNIVVLGVIQESHAVGIGMKLMCITIFHNQFGCRTSWYSVQWRPDQCRTTQCNACYYSMDALETPSSCDRKSCMGGKFTRCLKSWASCVEWANRQQNKVRINNIISYALTYQHL